MLSVEPLAYQDACSQNVLPAAAILTPVSTIYYCIRLLTRLNQAKFYTFDAAARRLCARRSVLVILQQ